MVIPLFHHYHTLPLPIANTIVECSTCQRDIIHHRDLDQQGYSCCGCGYGRRVDFSTLPEEEVREVGGVELVTATTPIVISPHQTVG